MDGHRSAGYIPGTWVGIIGEDIALLAEFDPAGPVSTACWDAVERGAGLDALLGVIVREGLRSVPNFALAQRLGTSVRVLVSGKASAQLEGSDPGVLSAAAEPTWLERTFDGRPEVQLLAAGTHEGGPQLPVTAGMVLASALTLTAPDVASAVPGETGASMPAESVPDGQDRRHDQEISADESAANFDHLFGATVEPVVPPPSRQPSEQHSLQQPTEQPAPVAQVAAAPAPAQPAAADAVPKDTMQPQGDSGVIESLPWRLPDAFRSAAQPPGPPPPAPEPQPAPEPIPQPAAGSGPVPVPEPMPHSAPAFQPGPPAPAPEHSAPMVAATACPNRHLGPPHAGTCRVCGTPVPQQEPFTVPRPVLGVLNLSTGDMVPLDRDVVLGRAPSAPDADPQARPHLVQLASPDNDVSRNHVRVGLEGWHVLITDLGSTNGTVVTLPGQQPVRLRSHDPFTIVPGTLVTIADEVSLRFEVHQ